MMLLLVGCGDNEKMTWGQALQFWDHAACDFVERCEPDSFAFYFEHDYGKCIAYYQDAECNGPGSGIDCAASYPWPTEYAESCAEDMGALSCDVDTFYFTAPQSCTAAYWVPGHGAC
jgi:hypothetical protein